MERNGDSRNIWAIPDRPENEISTVELTSDDEGGLQRPVTRVAHLIKSAALVLVVGPAVMLFTLLAIYSDFSFVGLAADYYGYAAMAAERPASPGHVTVISCAAESLSFCDVPRVSEVSVTRLAQDAGDRIRLGYWISAVLSYGLLQAYRLYSKSRQETLLYVRGRQRPSA
jgi:hypothetical protein